MAGVQYPAIPTSTRVPERVPERTPEKPGEVGGGEQNNEKVSG